MAWAVHGLFLQHFFKSAVATVRVMREIYHSFSYKKGPKPLTLVQILFVFDLKVPFGSGVVVARDQTDGLRFFIDGVLVDTADPTPLSGVDLSGSTDWLIGSR